MPAYEHAGFEPPAAVARTVVGAPDGSVEVQGVVLLLDTGADVSVIPQVVATAWASPRAHPGFACRGTVAHRPKRMSPTCGWTCCGIGSGAPSWSRLPSTACSVATS